ncbi:hypothetical protein CEP53_010034 [Fusarium sp. AF-6]|nr:hypothetical protein CEP53_010034 [Fusarium sp. AF-6]
MVGTRPRHPQVRALTHNCAWDLDDSRIIEPNEGDWVTETKGYFPKATYLSLASTSCADVIALFFQPTSKLGLSKRPAPSRHNDQVLRDLVSISSLGKG